MIQHSPRSRPQRFSTKMAAKAAWSRPFCAVEFVFEWTAYALSQWPLLEALEYLGSFGVLVAVVFYFAESGHRVMQRHYQAWQVINTAQGKGGSGGRIEALQELNADKVSLIGVDVSGAFLKGISLTKARLNRANFNAVDARNSAFRAADFSDADLRSANFRDSDLSGTDFSGADLAGADLTGSTLAECNFSGASLENAELHGADLQGIRWQELSSVRGAKIAGVRNAPSGFIAWALQHGAVHTSEQPK
jgi:Pentapeptide repeats (8 copies)